MRRRRKLPAAATNFISWVAHPSVDGWPVLSCVGKGPVVNELRKAMNKKFATIGLGLAVGVGLGAALGAAAGAVSVWLAAGVAFGVLFMAAAQKASKQQ